MTRRARLSAGVCVVGLLLGPAARAQRRVAVVVDTSNSMSENDPQRYALQVTQILSDLSDNQDSFAAVRMDAEDGAGGLFGLFGSGCRTGVHHEQALRLDPRRREAFKRDLDARFGYNTGTNFAAPIRTALDILGRDGAQPRLLLVVADSGGLSGSCEAPLTHELTSFRQSGGLVAAVNLGSTSGAFDSNPAFELTDSAPDAAALVRAVARVYQRFLGLKQVQTGQTQGRIDVNIAPFTRTAHLVVAGDGPVQALRLDSGHPQAAQVDLDFRGGGSIEGLDGRTRGYRIARLDKPAAGRWSFDVSGLGGAGGGWMLIQDSSIGMRWTTPPQAVKGQATAWEIELYDQTTGQRLSDPGLVPGAALTLDVDGHSVRFADDGSGGDREAGDGIFSATVGLEGSGRKSVAVRLDSEQLERRLALEVDVADAAWRLRPELPARAEVDTPVELRARLEALGASAALTPPERIDVPAAGVSLTPQGPPEASGTRIYAGRWTPTSVGPAPLELVPVGGTPTASAQGTVEVMGRLRLGEPVAIRLPALQRDTTVTGVLDLGAADARGRYELQLTAGDPPRGTVLEIETPQGWVELGGRPVSVWLGDGAARRWSVRLRAGGCLPAHSGARLAEVQVEATSPQGQVQRLVVPVEGTLRHDAWLRCFWPLLAAALALALGAVVVHGFVSPSRFPSRLGVQLSPEEDVNEGFFHPIRAQRGTGAGFYRDARVYVRPDYRLSASPQGALARLRAERRQVYVQALPGASVYKQTADGQWEPLPPGESPARFGLRYRNESRSLYFEVRNG